MNSFANFLWSLVRWAVPVTVAGVIAAVAVGTSRINEEIRGHVERAVAARFPGLRVEVQGATLEEGRGIVLRGLSLTDPLQPEPWQQLLRIDEVHLACDVTLADLALGPPEITAVQVVRPVLQIIRSKQGAWNLQQLFSRPSSATAIPISVDGATLLFEDVATGFRETFRQGRLDLKPASTDPAGVA